MSPSDIIPPYLDHLEAENVTGPPATEGRKKGVREEEV